MHLLYLSERPADGYLVETLRQIGHVVDLAGDLADGAVRLAATDYDAALLDGPRPDPRAVATMAAANGRTVLLAVADRLEGRAAEALRAGADACLERPVHAQELQARLRALLRVGERVRLPPAVLAALDRVRAERAVVAADGRRVSLSPRELQILTYLIRRAGEVVGPEQLGAAVWGEGAEPDPARVRTALGRLRRRLAPAGEGPIEAVAGQGWVFKAG